MARIPYKRKYNLEFLTNYEEHSYLTTGLTVDKRRALLEFSNLNTPHRVTH